MTAHQFRNFLMNMLDKDPSTASMTTMIEMTEAVPPKDLLPAVMISDANDMFIVYVEKISAKR